MTDPEQLLTLDVVVPVYNEQVALEASIRSLHAYLAEALPYRWRITIADNASTDGTPAIAHRLAAELSGVVSVRLAEKGRGRALKQVWSSSPAEILAYLDVDLSTDLRALPPLIAPLLSGHSDLAIGTRLSGSSRVVRGTKREFISRGYNLLLRRTMAVGFSDAQCGFKAIRADVAHLVLPHVEDTGWFFDTELLILAERSGLRIHEVPVDWIDDPTSSVDILRTARDDVLGLVRVSRGMLSGRIPLETIYAQLGRAPFEQERPATLLGQVVRFGVVGALSTAAFALLYLLLEQVMPAQAANFVSLLTTAMLNTAANRRFTFGLRGPRRVVLHQAQGIAIFAVAWALTAGALAVLHAAAPAAGATTELVVLTAANLLGTLLRFALLRSWVFRPAPHHSERAAHPVAVPHQKVTAS